MPAKSRSSQTKAVISPEIQNDAALLICIVNPLIQYLSISVDTEYKRKLVPYSLQINWEKPCLNNMQGDPPS